LLIHASKGKAGEIFVHEPPFKKYISDFKQLPFGYIVGKVILTDVIRIVIIRSTIETLALRKGIIYSYRCRR
jgi:hypothetical protein